MRNRLQRQPWRRRIVALAVAYLLALSGIIGSFVAASAEAFAAEGFGAVICHSADPGQPSPASDQQNSPLCDGSCCIGCLLLAADVPAPPTIAAAIEHAPGRLRSLPVKAELPSDPQDRSHQSRAPPRKA
jgi:hypothetical protein